MCLLKIPNEISNINSFATGEMFRDVSNKRYKGNSISRQQQNYWKKYTSDSGCRQYPFLNKMLHFFGVDVCPPRSIRCTKFNSLATRTKMFTMGPKTQRNLFFSSKTIEKSILATPPVSLLYKKTCRWIAD